MIQEEEDKKNNNNYPKLSRHSSLTIVNEDYYEDNNFKEGNYGWFVVFTSIWCYGIIIGMQNNYAIIYLEFVNLYNSTKDNVVYAAWIGSTSNGFQFLGCIPASFLVELYGPRIVAIWGGFLSTLGLALCTMVTTIEMYFLTYGILFGIGQALLLISTLTILPHYFKKKLSLANGIMNCGAVPLTVCTPILTAELLNVLSLKYVWLVLSSMCFLTIICSASFKPRFKKVKTDEPIINKVRDCFGIEIFKNKKFVIWSLASFVGIFGNVIPLITINHYSSFLKNFPAKHLNVLLNVAFAASSGLSAIIFGKIADKTKNNKIHFHTASFLVFGIAEICMAFVPDFTSLLIISSILGICDGLYLCVLMPILFEITGSSKLTNQATGYYHAAISVPVILGPVISGFIFEYTGVYKMAYIIGGSSCLICSFMLCLIPTGKNIIKQCAYTNTQTTITSPYVYENPNYVRNNSKSQD